MCTPCRHVLFPFFLNQSQSSFWSHLLSETALLGGCWCRHIANAFDGAAHGFIEILSLGGAETPPLSLLFPCRLLLQFPCWLLISLSCKCYSASGRSSDLSGLYTQVISSHAMIIRHIPVSPEYVGHVPVSPGWIFQV